MVGNGRQAREVWSKFRISCESAATERVRAVHLQPIPGISHRPELILFQAVVADLIRSARHQCRRMDETLMDRRTMLAKAGRQRHLDCFSKMLPAPARLTKTRRP